MTASADTAMGMATDEAVDATATGTTTESAEYFVFPLSPQQEAFHREDCALPGNPAYNGAFRHELIGVVDEALWEKAWNELIARHEALRACVRAMDGRAMLAVAETMHLSLVRRDLRDLPDAEREARMEQLCIEDAQHHFELGRGPLIRVGLIRLDDRRYVQTLTLHHLVCDGWSIGILMDELPVLYAALVGNEASPLPSLEIEFGDYLVWLQSHLATPQIAEETAYWMRKLAGYRRLDLAPDLEPPAGPLLASDIVSQTLTGHLVGELRRFSDEQGGTLFITGLAAVMALLQRETGRNDLGVGSPVAGRSRPELEKLVGPLLNHVLIRVAADAATTLRQLEGHVREALFEAFAHQDVPLEHVAEALTRCDPETPDPLYSISFVSQRAFAGGSRFTSESAGVKLRTLPSKSQGALYDLFFFLIEREDGWRLSLDYRTARFSAERARRLIARLVDILQAIAANADQPLDAIRFSDESAPVAEASVAENAGNRVEHGEAETEGHYALPASYAQERFWLLNQADPESTAFNMPAALRIRGPLDVAVLQQSFGRLLARHEILRTSLEEIGGELKQVIAPAVDLPFTEMTVEPALPAGIDEQLVAIVRREGAIAFDLTKAPLARCLLARVADDDHLLVLTLHDSVSDAQSLANLQRELWATYDALRKGSEPDLAPVDVQYGDYAAWQREWVASDAAETQLAVWRRKLASPLTVLDFPLDREPGGRAASGIGHEVLELSSATVARLKTLAQANNATMFALTGAAFAMLLARYARQDDVLFGSPVANRSTVTETMLGRFAGPMALRFDLAGDPTLADVVRRARDETYDALGNAEYPFELLLEQIDARAVGGRNPLFQFYFLYQNAFLQAQQTSELEIRPLPGQGVGTTFELQLALIERAGSVTMHLDYNPALLDPATIRGVLSYYTYLLESLLSDPQQRLSALREPDIAPAARAKSPRRGTRPPYVAPRTDLEQSLVALWERFLKQTPIGVHDDFFDLGGQSLLAARMIAAIQKELGHRISISVLAYARTIAQMAAVIEGRESVADALVVPLRPGNARAPLFLVHCGGGNVLRYQELVAALPEGGQVFGLTAPPIEEIDDATTVEQLARRYITAVQTVQPSGPYTIAGHSFGGLVAYQMAAALVAQGETVRMLGIFDTASPAYYRALPRIEKWRMRSLHIAEVLTRYTRRLVARDFAGIKGLILNSAENYTRKAKWWLQKLRGTSPGEAGEDGKDYLSEFTAIARRYTPPRLEAEMVLFHARERGWEYRSNPTLGWEKVVEGGIAVRYVPGTHESIMLRPNVAELARSFTQAARGN